MTDYVLAIDLETSGLPPKGVSIGDPQYPWMVEVGAVLFPLPSLPPADAGEFIFSTRVIAADGRQIQAGAAAVHGITTRDAGRFGVSEVVALGVICGYARNARWITGFNVAFDRDIVHSALILLKKDPTAFTRRGLQIVDLLPPATAACKLPSDHESGGYRWPKLSTAMNMLLGEEPSEGKHRALPGAQSAQRLFAFLHARGMLDIS